MRNDKISRFLPSWLWSRSRSRSRSHNHRRRRFKRRPQCCWCGWRLWRRWWRRRRRRCRRVGQAQPLPDLRAVSDQNGQRDEQDDQGGIDQRKTPLRFDGLHRQLSLIAGRRRRKINLSLRFIGNLKQIVVRIESAVERLLLFFVRGEDGTEQRLQVLRGAMPAQRRQQPLQAQVVVYADCESLTAQVIEKIAEGQRAELSGGNLQCFG